MPTTDKHGFDLTITTRVNVTDEQLSDLLSIALGAPYGVAEVRCDPDALNQAKDQIAAEGIADPDFETILARVLLNGSFIDCKAPEEDDWQKLYLFDLLKGLKMRMAEMKAVSMEQFLERADTDDGDAVLQYGLYGEIVYG